MTYQTEMQRSRKMKEGKVVGLKCRFGGAVERGEEKKKKKEKIEEDVWKKKKEKRIKEEENEWWRIKRVKEYKNKKKKKLLGNWATAYRLCLSGDVG
jgi:hypothetical protein